MKIEPQDDHWLTRRETVRALIVVGLIVLAVVVAVQTVIHVKGHFGVDGWFGFAALFGFASCFVMVVFAKGLGRLLKRDEQYYDD